MLIIFLNEEHLQQYATETYGWEDTLNAAYGEDIISAEFHNTSTKISLQNEEPSLSKKQFIEKDLLSLEDDDLFDFPDKEYSSINIWKQPVHPHSLIKKKQIYFVN